MARIRRTQKRRKRRRKSSRRGGALGLGPNGSRMTLAQATEAARRQQAAHEAQVAMSQKVQTVSSSTPGTFGKSKTTWYSATNQK